VTNTTPLITLAGVGLLDLLPLLYGKVWAPRIVLDEYQAKAPPTEPDKVPLAEPQLEVITEAYTLTRYGGDVPDEAQLELVRRKWAELDQKWV